MDNSAPAIDRLRVNLDAVTAGLRSSLERSPRDSQVGAPASHSRERWRWILLTVCRTADPALLDADRRASLLEHGSDPDSEWS